MFRAIPKSVIIGLLGYFLLYMGCIFVPDLVMECFIKFIFPIFCYVVFPLLVGWIVCIGRVATGELYLLFVMMACFLPSFLLRWRLPNQIKTMLYFWPVICFMMGLAYHQPLDNTEFDDFYLYIPFYLCLVPAWVGLIVGKMKKDKQ